MGFAEDTRAKWHRWLEIILAELQDALVYRHLFREVREIVLANATLVDTPSIYWAAWFDTYVHYGASAIRRQLKDSDESISLARLLRELVEHPTLLSREWYLRDHPGGNGAWFVAQAHRAFDRFAGSAGQHVDATLVGTDLAALLGAGKDIEGYVDRVVAHRDRRPPRVIPTLTDMDKALDVSFELASKYHLLLERSGYAFPVAAWVGDEWRDLFKVPWISNEADGVRGT
jgi:hypothetical protein